MNSSKDYFLSTLGVSVPPSLSRYDLTIQRATEKKPFCSILTNKDGVTVLRVNPWEPQGVTITIP